MSQEIIEHLTDHKPVRAAQYLRMSMEHQQYSIDNQMAAIERYADEHGFEIVSTYSDEGKSGVTIERRDGLLQLLEDVEAKRAGFSAILVFDVSRWGRFQNPDDAAIYEVRCRWAGVPVHYCAEHFQNDGSVISSIMKALKRAMAAEYSRELSVKVSEGHVRMLKRGFHQGGFPPFGLQRVLIDAYGNRKSVLQRGERKNIQSDRVVLEPGPADDVAIVNEVYRRYLAGETQRSLIDDLNARGITNASNKPWAEAAMKRLLTSESYVGNIVWGKSSSKLGNSKKSSVRSAWVRHENAFAPTVDAAMFWQVQAEIKRRASRIPGDQMLQDLRKLFKRHGMLSKALIDRTPDVASTALISRRFGSLSNAYAKVGYGPLPANEHMRINSRIASLTQKLARDVGRQLGDNCTTRSDGPIAIIESGQRKAAIIVGRYIHRHLAAKLWFIDWRQLPSVDVVVIARMTASNDKFRDYFVLRKDQLDDIRPLGKRSDCSKLMPYRQHTRHKCVGSLRSMLA